MQCSALRSVHCMHHTADQPGGRSVSPPVHTGCLYVWVARPEGLAQRGASCRLLCAMGRGSPSSPPAPPPPMLCLQAASLTLLHT
jgi:hypothetical protein